VSESLCTDPGPWNDAARAIGDGDLARAADIIETIGHTAAAAYTRLRAAEAFTAAGRPAEAAAQRAEAESFYQRWQRMAGRGKPHQKIVVACARELAGFVWAIATDQPLRST
jgi:hypothetical protein